MCEVTIIIENKVYQFNSSKSSHSKSLHSNKVRKVDISKFIFIMTNSGEWEWGGGGDRGERECKRHALHTRSELHSPRRYSGCGLGFLFLVLFCFQFIQPSSDLLKVTVEGRKWSPMS